MNPIEIQSKLHDFHKDKVKNVLTHFSDIAGKQFQGEFNVSGFHKEILNLPNNIQSIWGVDRCLRLQEIPDRIHSYLFHMGIYAESLDLKGEFVDPFKDNRFHQLQEKVISQFLDALALFDADLNEVEVTYLGGVTVGTTNEGRDKILKRKYEFPADAVSKNFLNGKVALFPVNSLANVDINPIEGALVGPRLEVAYKGVEIGTIVFDCFRVKDGKLAPINYVAGYAIGIERLAASLSDKSFLTSIHRYQEAHEFLSRICIAADSSLFEREAMALIYSAEVVASAPDDLSKHQEERMRIMNKNVAVDLKTLGLDDNVFNKLVSVFKQPK